MNDIRSKCVGCELGDSSHICGVNFHATTWFSALRVPIALHSNCLLPVAGPAPSFAIHAAPLGAHRVRRKRAQAAPNCRAKLMTGMQTHTVLALCSFRPPPQSPCFDPPKHVAGYVSRLPLESKGSPCRKCTVALLGSQCINFIKLLHLPRTLTHTHTHTHSHTHTLTHIHTHTFPPLYSTQFGCTAGL